ncbi:Hsp20/alpha crystallin family protein [Candidatus Thiothrix sp. Deng01]|uniref:Hsp20/alpha crystallin family protein n=1 Tax=Candidatus Thiothrix phosphatis TaxID=3112415 RepID=A0ABU6D1A2_9GAMM|nr:Hsp20/alpha crystallin family protein [Candidatus Thiothrix sp. Deng01]MEB4592159.1 Hsp20/alpha crystallin family protein [Candidatus Thiothrix sp. Deng01]
MNVTRYEPWSLLNQLQREMDNLMRRDTDTTSPMSDWTPAVDIRETPGAWLLHADIPGVKAEDIEIHMESGVLSISGKREFDSSEEKEGYKRVERVRGRFHRRFSLPDTANGDKITAKSSNGVLDITIPKQEKVLPRKIAVQIES